MRVGITRIITTTIIIILKKIFTHRIPTIASQTVNLMAKVITIIKGAAFRHSR